MTSLAPALPQVAPPDPTKHVDYQQGMVLGVDDFEQEFAYGSGRDKRIVRDLIGYGVVSGLRVTVDTVADQGPRVSVAPGEMVTPSGQFVCVSPAQCALLNDWLAANAGEVIAATGPSPRSVQLAVVGCYQPCETDQVPIPGEPCRSDDELRKPSRIKDSFDLQLRLSAPPQIEDLAVRDFVAWVRAIPIVDEPAGDVDAWIERIRELSGLEASPPASPPTLLGFLYASPPPSVTIPRSDAPQYLAALFAFWVSDLRAHLRSGPGGECGCSGGPAPLDPCADSLCLAEVTVPLETDAITGALVVADTPAVSIRDDDTVRPSLLHLKLLQEWMLVAAEAVASGGVTASGRFQSNGAAIAATGGLTAKALDGARTLFALTFRGYDPLGIYVVTGQAVAGATDAAPSTFEALVAGDPQLSPPAVGIVVRVKTSTGAAVPGGFMVRIEEVSA